MLITLARLSSPPVIEPRFALCFDGRLRDELLAAGAKVHDLGNARLSQPLSVWRARKSLKALLTNTRFDVVVCQSAWSQALFGPVVRSANLPLVLWVHGAPNAGHWLERLGRRTAADLNICNSEFTAQLSRSSSPLIRSEVLYCPVAPPARPLTKAEREDVRDALGTPAESVVIIHASRMEPWKGHFSLINALGKLKASPRWVCWIAGGAQRPAEVEYLNGLKRKAAELGIADRISFLGHRADIETLLAVADIHCQPNTEPEPFGIAFVEAFHARLPVVTTAIGGACEVVDDKSGILVSPRDENALAASLRQLIEDEPMRRRLGSAGPDRARYLCDPENQIRKLEALLSSVQRQEMAA